MLIANNLKLIVTLKHNTFQCQRFCSDLKILFFGTDNFSRPSLQKLSLEKLARLEVVTSFKARNNPIKAFAETNGIKVYDWTMFLKNENYQMCREFDLGLVVSFGHLIPEDIIKCFKFGMLNVHASLLPKYRGASPIIYSLRNGEKETGVSIMRIEPKKFDVGEVFATEKIEISDDLMMPELHNKLAVIGAELLMKSVRNLNELQRVEQDDSEASYAPKIDHEFCKVRWNEMSSTDVYNLYRSIFSFKHMQTSFNNEPLKLIEIARVDTTDSPEDNKHCPPGQLFYCPKSKKLLIKCADENFVEIRQLSIGKKKAMSAADFRNGFLKNCDESDRKFQ